MLHHGPAPPPPPDLPPQPFRHRHNPMHPRLTPHHDRHMPLPGNKIIRIMQQRADHPHSIPVRPLVGRDRKKTRGERGVGAEVSVAERARRGFQVAAVNGAEDEVGDLGGAVGGGAGARVGYYVHDGVCSFGPRGGWGMGGAEEEDEEEKEEEESVLKSLSKSVLKGRGL